MTGFLSLFFFIIDVSIFESLGLGSFYGVAMGAHEPAKLIIVEYNGGKKNEKTQFQIPGHKSLTERNILFLKKTNNL